MSLQETEKKVNKFLLDVIIGFSFIADSKYEINTLVKKHLIQIYDHLIHQYQKYKKFYLEFKKRYQEHKKISH